MLLARRNNNSDWMSNFFDDFFNTDLMPRMNATAPAVNVKEDAEKYTMDVAAPGLKKEYCRININEDGDLELKLENKMEHKDENKNEHYLRREFSYSNYEQTYSLPDDVDRSKVSANVSDGILHIVMPKLPKQAEEKKLHKIEIK